MREVITSGVTPQRKLIGTNKHYGNKGIKMQQGSTLVLYDTLPVDGRTEFRFFEGANNRNFPQTNVGANGNRLNVGSSMIVERAYLSLVLEVESVFEEATGIAGNGPLNMAEFTMQIANKEVIKHVPVMSWLPTFNKSSESTVNENFEFDTQVALLPLLEYICIVRTPALAAITDTSLRLTIEGTGAIISPNAPF
jgi:hypothetical protein